jgi:hypothetical protein
VDFVGRQQHMAFLGGIDYSAIAEDTLPFGKRSDRPECRRDGVGHEAQGHPCW